MDRKFTDKQRAMVLERILETVDDWDLDTLIDYVKGTFEDKLKTCTDEELESEFEENTGSQLKHEYEEFCPEGEEFFYDPGANEGV